MQILRETSEYVYALAMLNPQNLGMYLRERRKSLGLSQQQVADRTGIDNSRISRIETGALLPTLYELPRLASALGA